MNSKEVRKVITFETIREILFSNEFYAFTIFSKLTGLSVDELMSNRVATILEELKSSLNKPSDYIYFSITSKATISDVIAYGGSICTWLSRPFKNLDKKITQINFSFGHLDTFNTHDLVSRKISDYEGHLKYEYLINLDYLYSCDKKSFANSDSLEYLLRPFICFDFKVLDQMYENDEMMQEVVKTLKNLKENAYVLEYNPVVVSV